MERYKIYIENYQRPGQPFFLKPMTISEFKDELEEKTKGIVDENNSSTNVISKSKRILDVLSNYEKLIGKLKIYEQIEYYYVRDAEDVNETIEVVMNHKNYLQGFVSDVQTETHNTKMADIVSSRGYTDPLVI